MPLIHDVHRAVASGATAPAARPHALNRVLPDSIYDGGQPARAGAALRDMVGIAALAMLAACGSAVEAPEQTGIVVVSSGPGPSEPGIAVAAAAPPAAATGADAGTPATSDTDDAVIPPDTMRDPDHMQYASLVE
ncbi:MULTISPECIES: hypothetical protein [unclassified Sphingomonas]|jgi:hypothetical protein|uniref:hypothetical protein n=1 Tax=unclassified Sphingomonas TaxID=196159 RepID=UPI0006F98A92|nr:MULTISPECIES: hypothetical protein [unclassified Sphingomonas]KQN21956.1 hypothetical protein ASE89_03120 [Sphingomonas sp. Leaf30]MBD8551663.1 hypothetical protein [Sphingomonas sp. CFBP 8764]